MPPSLDAPTVRTWCRLALAALGRAREEIDAINVYPVADGDTGTNLYLTVESAAQSVEAVFDAHAAADSTADPAAGAAGTAAGPTLPEAFRAMSHGALIGARGNSGTILAQLLRGMNGPLTEDAGGPDATALRRALRSAADSAYEAVARPVEGTILTVARAAASAAEAAVGGLAEVVRAAHTGARTALAATPAQLGVLRNAGVVDAGGLGLVAVLAALSDAVTGDTATTPGAPVAPAAGRAHAGPTVAAEATADAATVPTDRLPGATAAEAGAVEGPAATPAHRTQVGGPSTDADAGVPTGGRTTAAGAQGATPPHGTGPTPAAEAGPDAAQAAMPAQGAGPTAAAEGAGAAARSPGAVTAEAASGAAQGAMPPHGTGQKPAAEAGPGAAQAAMPSQSAGRTAAAEATADAAGSLTGRSPLATAAEAGSGSAPAAMPAQAAGPTAAAEATAPAGGPEDCQAVGGPAFEVVYLLEAANAAIPPLRARLDRLGDSLVVVGGDGLWSVHVHVDDVGAAVEAGIEAGRPYRIRVTHFGEQVSGGAGRPERAVVALVRGDGMAELCAQAGATVVAVRAGEQPASGDIAAAIRRARAREVIVLPNDTELRHTAAAAVEQARADGVRVALIPTRSAVQGIAALAVHEPSRRFDEDVVAMTSAAGATRYAEVAVAERESWTMAGVCQAGDVLGLIDGDVAVIGADVTETAVRVLDRMLAAGGEMVTLVLGATAPPGLAARLESHVRGRHLAVDTVTYDGGQAACPLLIGVE
ncbi:DAK2 domain-containing protein [Actinacidiphila paucisporea]|uniref:DAK2 domain-containing protein n=1 Tax=Actinacidiphila paucisporea TaxID=310782 RepID=A0A1M7KX33_9ACTN|nr:DAK2 domain-containing protein [Actinacidiphila paucisporea]SHM70126.1 DAK2 domain-containing protein [Actinacidiphila paucisporea]